QQGGQQANGQQQGGGQGGGGQQGGLQSGPQGQWDGSPNRNNGGPFGGGNPYGGGGDRYNGGPYGAYRDGPIRPQDLQQSYRDTLQQLQQLEQQLRNDPSGARDVQGMIRDLRQFDPFTYSNDPMLSERIKAALAGVEQVEMELRRKV